MTSHPAAVPALRARRPPARVAQRLAWVLAAAGVLAQMSFPLSDGGTLPATLVCVAGLAGAAVAHAAATRGAAAAAALVAVAGGGGLVAEAVGVATGLPFGAYHYTGTLGPSLVGVPLIVPAAWLMMLYPSLVLAQRLVGGLRPGRSGRGRVATAAVGAWAMTTWDLFLDPQLVDAGHWVWQHPAPSLPGVAGIPLTNLAGWLGVSFVLCWLVDRCWAGGRGAGSAPSRPDPLAETLFLWTYASFVLADTAFFGRPRVALTAGLLMGTVAVPLALAQWRQWRAWRG